jgi:hypothetical protein
MKFRTLSRIVYLKKARHRRGHGIHSPFLFRLITTVIEDKRRLPVYKTFKELNNQALNLLDSFSNPEFSKIYDQFNLRVSKPRKLYRKVELQFRYAKVVYRLINDFKPSSIIHYGPTLGVNLVIMATADYRTPVYQVIDDYEFNFFCADLLKDSTITNIHFLSENAEPFTKPDLIVINYPYHPEKSRSIVAHCLMKHGNSDVIIIRGIHESKMMEQIWQELIATKSVRVSLDLFEIGIALFRKGLQKENFIHRF